MMDNTPKPEWQFTLCILTAAFALSSIPTGAAVTLTDLRCEYRVDPLGIDNVAPRLSWKLSDAEQERGQKQTAYQVLVASSVENLNANQGDLWDSQEQRNAQSVNNVYQGKPLPSGQRCFWKVRIRDAAGILSDWSEHATFTVGLLQPSDWSGSWIHKADQEKADHNWFRKTFILSEAPTSGLVYVGSFGYHELYVNGEKVTDNVMNPVSSYMKERIPYLTYDISDRLNTGDNIVAVWHAAGWARWNRIREFRNPPFVFKAQIEITTTGGPVTLATDTSWRCKKSHSEYAGEWDILRFGGERIDARKLEPDWNTIDYDDRSWTNAAVWAGRISAQLSTQMVEPQVRYEIVTPVAVTRNDNGTCLIDMGKNYTGQFEIYVRNGSTGDRVTFEISDQLEKVCNWEQKSEYIFDDTKEGLFANRFNVAGGRWITVTGLNYTPELNDIRGYVITNNRKRISTFECSNDLLNQIYEANLDTYIANTLDGILMDCPHRERRGWGEVTVAAMYGDALPNYESGAYMDQYTQYMRDAQFSDGRIRAVINEEDRPFLMWKANSPITVWETYRMLGDKKMLQDNYASMQKWMTWLLSNSDYATGGALVIGEQGKREFPGLGDWCTPRGNFWDSSNSPEAAHFNNCLYAYMLDCAVKTATVLERRGDAKMYADRLRVQREATHELYYDPATGDYGNGRQVNQAFALIAGVTPESEKQKVYENLVDEVLYAFPYYDTGSSGQALYSRYFTEHGERMDLIHELLTDTHHPSYGHFLRTGANVWPERWSAVGNSRIHTCYTGIGGYFIKGFGGIRPDPADPGMRSFLIKPTPVGDLTFANTTFESMYGTIVVKWRRTDTSASYHIEIPVNSTATVYLPAAASEHVNENGMLAEHAEGVTYLGTEHSDAVGNYVIYQVASGVYEFTVNKLPSPTYPDPQYTGRNLAAIGRMSASSMHIASEKNPGFEAFNANDGDEDTCWQAGTENNQWLEAAWVKPQTFNEVVIAERGDHMTSHKIQYWNGVEWLDLSTGTSVAGGRTHTFNAITATRCRLLIAEAAKAASVAEFQIHNSAR